MDVKSTIGLFCCELSALSVKDAEGACAVLEVEGEEAITNKKRLGVGSKLATCSY